MIYTSNYSRACRLDRSRYCLVRISVTKPGWFEQDGSVPALFPDFGLVQGYKDGSVSEAAYTERYTAHLNGRETAIRSEIARVKELTGGRDLVLLCWCAKGVFCHRHLFAQWWTEHTGEPVQEL